MNKVKNIFFFNKERKKQIQRFAKKRFMEKCKIIKIEA